MASEIDWAGTGAMMQGFAALGAATAAGFTAYFASKALTAWRGEMVGRRKAELAEEVLAATYEATEKIKESRIPMAFSGEGVTFHVPEGVTPQQRANAQALYAPAERLVSNPEFWARFEAVRFRAKAFFGLPAWDAVNAVLRVRREIHTASSTLARNALRAPQAQISDAMVAALEAKIWDSDEPDDPLTVRLKDALMTIEGICGPAISDRPSN